MSEPLRPIEMRFDRLDEHIERVEARLDQYHGETRELIASMLAILRQNAAAGLDVARSLRENTDQVRANTEAVLRLLDRFGDGPLPAH